MIDTAFFDPLSPKRLEDIVGNTETWKNVSKQIQENCASNIVLVGPAGCGKTLFMKLTLASHPTLFIECTANSGLRDVREAIRTFARGSRTSKGDLRWIIFEHADGLTSDTQAFLRRMLETTAGTTRFIFECRDAGAITEPILSRASIVSIAAPDDTEIVYEIQRRTNFKLDAAVANDICKISYGNLRLALLNALAVYNCAVELQLKEIEKYLADRPKTSSSSADEWMKWAIETETLARDNGIDLRDILRVGWPLNPIVNHICATWSRLGGTSPRTLFYDCISKIELCG